MSQVSVPKSLRPTQLTITTRTGRKAGTARRRRWSRRLDHLLHSHFVQQSPDENVPWSGGCWCFVEPTQLNSRQDVTNSFICRAFVVSVAGDQFRNANNISILPVGRRSCSQRDVIPSDPNWKPSYSSHKLDTPSMTPKWRTPHHPCSQLWNDREVSGQLTRLLSLTMAMMIPRVCDDPLHLVPSGIET